MNASNPGAEPVPVYRAPVIRRIGSVADLTRGGVPSTANDSGNNAMRP